MLTASVVRIHHDYYKEGKSTNVDESRMSSSSDGNSGKPEFSNGCSIPWNDWKEFVACCNG